jgi:hypothetical protein
MGEPRTFEAQLEDYLAIKRELRRCRDILTSGAASERPATLAGVSDLIAGMRARLMKIALLADCGARREKLAIELADMDRDIAPFWEPVLHRVAPAFP